MGTTSDNSSLGPYQPSTPTALNKYISRSTYWPVRNRCSMIVMNRVLEFSLSQMARGLKGRLTIESVPHDNWARRRVNHQLLFKLISSRSLFSSNWTKYRKAGRNRCDFLCNARDLRVERHARGEKITCDTCAKTKQRKNYYITAVTFIFVICIRK